MAKNRADNSIKTKGSFFKTSPQNISNSKFQYKTRKEGSKFVPQTDSDNFFIKSDNPVSNKSKTSKAHDLQENNEYKRDKKPFDKKRYRLQKYSKKYQIQQWEDKRKKAVLRNYYKSLNEDPSSSSTQISKDSRTDDFNNKEEECSSSMKTLETGEAIQGEAISNNDSNKKRSKPFRKAHQEFQRIKEEKEKEKELLLKKKMERKEALQEYKKKKIEKYKKLNKKTKKGQPIMKDRMEMLLEKIQNSLTQ